ncbi:MAG: hypothetical protein IKU78_06285 [Paludibacteraceae bacterium]|nr:hypothetical protein [Paludibacteraceae bacterium]
MILEYEYFKNTFNSKLFEDSYSDLIKKIADNPERYIGLFRPTKPKTKLIQNITQSHEIRFGDALEFIFERYFEKTGFLLQEKRFREASGDDLSIDQLFSKGKTLYMIEQKVRDDHDSTKKKGQFDNFEKKYFALTQRFHQYTIIPIMWFIDDSLKKNRSYYIQEMNKMKCDYQCTPYLFYGEEMFLQIDDFDNKIWNEILNYLECWKKSLPDMPEINFDKNAEIVFDEIKDISPSVYRKLFANQEIVDQIFPIIFPEGVVLDMLKKYFQYKNQPIYLTLTRQIESTLGNKRFIHAKIKNSYIADALIS